ncbi:hypothetical protein BGZ61DRAFT_139526 [Ilyonectria robusta]|uniref:uncharacterized protein n=1 Tax=Ilyonectria robusta TaxID=1079257 RepID=UPI001E8DB950|nr:uncharacterized protein BGZ61DRAFT_139526 [Ilyonectria robusta]KAH8665306.1 hypothetical protein BGZ61DRAFT_139526 [Ilyonectria robusta]
MMPQQTLGPRPLALNKTLEKRQAASAFSPPLTPPHRTDTHASKTIELDLQSSPITRAERPLVAVIGVGYVGTHLVETFSRGFDTLGFDISDKRISEVQPMFKGNERVMLSSITDDLDDATHFLISVPTLLRPDRSVDASYLRSALRTVATHARRGSTVVIESSVAIGMTRELLGPLAKDCGFFVGMSPERVDPGRTEPPAYDIPKVVSGLDDVAPGSLDSILRLYSAVFNHVVPVSKPEVAEMTKLYENCQRMMCIAYANEMADACIPHGIDPYEVCGAAASKPFGYMPYMPGPGVGGHCIPINPYYLLSNSKFPLLSAATEAMWRRPADIAARAIETLENAGLGKSQPRVLVVGVGFKPGQSTLSNSPGLDIIKSLAVSSKVDVSFADTMVTQEMVPQVSRLDDRDWNADTLEQFDMILIAMRQVGLDYQRSEQNKTLPNQININQYKTNQN